jgi:hypothetical protein
MRMVKWAVLIMVLALFAGCASKKAPADTGTSGGNTATQGTAAGSQSKQGAQAASSEGEIIGKPAKHSKFAKLKLGMPLKDVVAKIGPPTNEWKHPTGKASIPFYFGADRWVIQYAYKHEGVLTFNYGGDQVLTRIEVNKAE